MRNIATTPPFCTAAVPTTSVGNSASFAILADKVIVEINLAHPLALEELHDIWIPGGRPNLEPLPIAWS